MADGRLKKKILSGIALALIVCMFCQSIHEVFATCKKKKQLPPEAKHPALLRCLAVQMSNNLQTLMLQSMGDFDSYVRSLNVRETKDQKAGFIMSLKAVNGKILLYPQYADIETAILDSYDFMLKAGNEIPKYKIFEKGQEAESGTDYLKPIILEEIISAMRSTVKEVVAEQSKHPQEYVKVRMMQDSSVMK